MEWMEDIKKASELFSEYIVLLYPMLHVDEHESEDLSIVSKGGVLTETVASGLEQRIIQKIIFRSEKVYYDENGIPESVIEQHAPDMAYVFPEGTTEENMRHVLGKNVDSKYTAISESLDANTMLAVKRGYTLVKVSNSMEVIIPVSNVFCTKMKIKTYFGELNWESYWFIEKNT